MRHHEEAVQRFVARIRQRADVVGVALTGSVARGEERADSDIDLLLVVDTGAWGDALAEGRIMYTETEEVGYAGGYFDVKLTTTAILEAAASRGDDPVRDSLATAKALFSRGIELEELLARAGGRSDGQWLTLAAAFVAQARLHGEYFLEHGLRHHDPLLTAHAAVHLATAAGRAALALHRVRYPGPKQLTTALGRLPDLPSGFTDALEALVLAPSHATGSTALALLEATAGAVLPKDASLSRFVLDNELAWFTTTPAPEYR